jgi:hypothetical protein
LIAVTVFVPAFLCSEAIMQISTLRVDDTPAPPAASGYEDDFLAWIDRQVLLMRARRFDLLDMDHLIEEIAAMSLSLHRELNNRLRQLVLHLLKCEYQPEYKSASWVSTINEQRASILTLTEQNPSLAPKVQEYADAVYERAVKAAAKETCLARATFPVANPYTREQLLDDDYLP